MRRSLLRFALALSGSLGLACSPERGSSLEQGSSFESNSSADSTSEDPVADLPASACAEGLAACEYEARAKDKVCRDACTDLDDCASGECRVRCGLDTVERLSACNERCEGSDEVQATNACWGECLDATLACYENPACEPSSCAYIRFTCSAPCHGECLEHTLELQVSQACSLELPIPLFISQVPYVELEIADTLVPYLDADACPAESGWTYADEQYGSIALCGAACLDAADAPVRITIGCPGETNDSIPRP